MRKEARVSLSALLVVLDVPADKLIRPRADGTTQGCHVCAQVPGLPVPFSVGQLGMGTSTYYHWVLIFQEGWRGGSETGVLRTTAV